MSSYEVPEPILNSPYEEPGEHWHIVEGETPRRLPGRRPAMYFYRDPKAKPEREARSEVGTAIELKLVNRIRGQVKAWKEQGYPGVTRTTLELLQWWRRDGREKRLFFAQLEAAETTIFLTEARQDFRQGIEIPREEVSEDKKGAGVRWVHPLCLQDGDRDGEDYGDGDAGGLERPQQSQRSKRRSVLRRGDDHLSQRDDPRPAT